LGDFISVAETEVATVSSLYSVVVICQPLLDSKRLYLDNVVDPENDFCVVSYVGRQGRNADALAHYFGEDPNRCPFEQVTATLLNFIRLFKKAHEENVKQAELEKKKALKEAEMEKAKGVNLTKKPVDDS
jgi:formin 2